MSKLNSYTTLRSKIIALGFAMALCLSGSSLAAQGNSHNTSTGPTDAAGGMAITNQASMTYTFGAASSGSTTSNVVTVYVNQIDVFYVAANDTGYSAVPAGKDVVTGSGGGAGNAVTFSNSVVNLSNGPVTLTVGIKTPTLTPILSGATYQSTTTYYSFAATGTGVSQSGSTLGSTITIPQGGTATVVVTVTPPVSATTPGGWDEFVTTFTDSTTAALVNSGNSAFFTVTPYTAAGNPTLWATYSGLDTQVTAEIDIAANANFGKLQLLDPSCGGSAFFTTSVAGNVRTTSSASFPSLASISWNRSGAQAGQPVAGTTGLLPVSANPGECIVYQIVLNNPLTTGSIATGAAITDTLNTNVSFVTTAGRTILTGIAGTVGTTAPSVTTTAPITAGGNVSLQYEALVK